MNSKLPLIQRRGMLLLLVVLMLSLFMGAGAILMTVAARARAAARASAAATQQIATSDMLARDTLDAALMAALRGATSGTNGSVTITGTTAPVVILENLLEDKYGTSISGTGSSLTGVGSPVMSFILSGVPDGTVERLGGRIATIAPQTGDGDISSCRILSVLAVPGGYRCYVAQLPGGPQKSYPQQSFTVVVNGREFTPDASPRSPESYDAYDNANLWLAQPVLANGQLSGTFARLSFSGTNISTATVDNDNDGVPDGIWLSDVIPNQSSPLGGTIRYQVSYLILDLDGRINVNATGMATGTQGSYAGTPNTPIGMGYGPADLAAPLLFPPTLPTSTGTYSSSTTWQTLSLGGTPTTTPAAPSTAQRRSPPLIGRIDGRSGTNSVPGGSGDDASVNQQTTTTTNAVINATTGGTNSIYTMTIAGQNAVADLKAQTRVYMSAPSAAGQITPTLNFFRPTWTGPGGADWFDDPYESRLDSDAPRFGLARRTSGTSPSVNDDSIFTIAELECILRPNDADASQLPQRLAAGLEDMAQRSRITITTDSWSTPGLTGLAARQIEDFIATLPMPDGSTWVGGSNVMSPDVAAGLRFNINRPIISGTSAAEVIRQQAQKQEFCKGLYTLVMGLGTGTGSFPASPSPAEVAQWAVNVLDFRDADSTMTRFAYDTNLSNGWQVDASSPVVYGAERPDVVITETAAWRDTTSGSAQLFVTLHRPNRLALLTTGSAGTTTSGTVEIPDIGLMDAAGRLDLAKTHDGTPTGSPIWQLRFSGTDAKVVQFRPAASSPFQLTQFWSATSGTATVYVPSVAPNPLQPNDYICVASSPAQHFSIAPPISTLSITSTDYRLSTTSPATISLERLADPSAPNSSNNPYIAVDSSRQNTENPFASPAAPLTSAWFTRRRSQPATSATNPAQSLTPFWQQPLLQNQSTNLTSFTVSGTNAAVAWFHWPNRPFVSQAELALVATGSASTDGVLANYSFPTNSLATSTTSIPTSFGSTPLGSLILDATYVPSRFAENAVTITGSSINIVGLDKLQANHFSKWREPGRVNVNTIVSGTTVLSGTTASLDDVVWTTLMGNTYVANPFIPKPAITATIPAVPAVPPTPSTPAIPAIPAIPIQPAQPANPARSVSQVLSLSGSGGAIVTQDFTTSGTTLFPRDKNPFFPYAQAIRLANTTTTQSNVFAIWITVKITDDSANAPSPVTRRLFAIIDRSIPVGYSPNKDLNVRDAIKIKRYLD